MIKIMHLADAHLDSPFTLENPSQAVQRRTELRGTFTSAMLAVRTEKVQVLLIAGDLFENKFATTQTADLLVKEFAACPDCKIFIAPGNHDYISENSLYRKTVFPENVHIFDSGKVEKVSIDSLGVDVYGYAFTSPYLETNPAAGIVPDDGSRINILLAHGDLLSPISHYCPITEKDIESSGFDYIALGHVHNGTPIGKAGKTRFAYSGCIEGRDYGECGYKGVIIGEIDKSGEEAKCALHHMRTSQRRYEVAELNLTGCADGDEVFSRINRLLVESGYGEDTLLRLVLGGDVSPDLVISASVISARFADRLYSLDTVDKTVPLFDYEKLRDDPTVKGAFFSKLYPVLTGGTPEKRRCAALALRYGLSALSGNDIDDV